MDGVVAYLRQLHAARDAGPGEPIFLGPASVPLAGNETRTRWWFRQLLKRAGIADVDELGRSVVIQSTRHTFA